MQMHHTNLLPNSFSNRQSPLIAASVEVGAVSTGHLESGVNAKCLEEGGNPQGYPLASSHPINSLPSEVHQERILCVCQGDMVLLDLPYNLGAA